MPHGKLPFLDNNENFQLADSCYTGGLFDLPVEELTWPDSCMPRHVQEDRKLMHDTSVANHNVVDWPGEYGFRVAFQAQEEIKKNMTWTFSEELRKLYVSLSDSCPIYFDTETCPPEGSTLCVVPIYKDFNHRLDAVRCCPSHSSGNAESGHSCRHWIRCDNRSTLYFEDSGNQNRLYLTVPFEASVPQDNLKVIYMFKFMCRNSCFGGPNRRSTQVLFILRSHDGVDLGRSVIDVKVCASPGRDRKREEEPARRETKVENPEPPTPGPSTEQHTGGTKRKYTLYVNSRPCYKLLLQISAGLELTRNGGKKMKCAKSILEALKASSSESSSD